MKSRIIPLFFILPAIFSFAPVLHPYYVSVTEIRIDPNKKTVTIGCKMISHDLEDALRDQYKLPIELHKKNPQCDSVLNVYIRSRLDVRIGKEKLNYEFIGYEMEEEAVWSYFECPLPSDARSVLVHASILYEFHAEQTNFVHCYYGDERQSFKLVNPNKEAAFAF